MRIFTEIKVGAGWKKSRWANMWLLPKERRSFLLKSCVSLVLVLSLSYTFGQEVGDEVSAETTASVYVNGTVITMDSDDNIAEAIAVKDGKIVAAASNQQILRLVDKGTKVIDLSGKVVLPGFYAAHDHLPEAGDASPRARGVVGGNPKNSPTTVGTVVFTEAACRSTSFVLQLPVAPWPAGSGVYGPGILYAKLDCGGQSITEFGRMQG